MFEQLSPIYKWTPGELRKVQSCPRRRSALATNRPTRWATRSALYKSGNKVVALRQAQHGLLFVSLRTIQRLCGKRWREARGIPFVAADGRPAPRPCNLPRRPPQNNTLSGRFSSRSTSAQGRRPQKTQQLVPVLSRHSGFAAAEAAWRNRPVVLPDPRVHPLVCTQINLQPLDGAIVSASAQAGCSQLISVVRRRASRRSQAVGFCTTSAR